MGSLESGIDELVGTDVAGLSYEELKAEAARISGLIDRLSYQLSIRVAEVDRRGAHRGDELAFPNVTAWMAFVCDLEPRESRRSVSEARVLSEQPKTAAMAASGELSRSRVRRLCGVARKHPDAYRRDEEMLLGFASELPLVRLGHALRYWSHVVDDTAEADAHARREKAYLHASATFEGMVRVDGLFDPERGEALLAALEAAIPPPSRSDRRPVANRRAEALALICEQWLSNGAPVTGGVRPHVSLLVDLDTLDGKMGKVNQLAHTGPITRETALRILCDAGVSRVITRGRSEILDLGREVRTATPAQRRALAIRDGGCVIPGCGRPPAWCDAHHRTHWIHDGQSDLDDLVLVCRWHHTLIHAGIVQLE